MSSLRLISTPSDRTNDVSMQTFASRRAGAPLMVSCRPGVNRSCVQPSRPSDVREANSQRHGAALPSAPRTVKYTYACGFTNSKRVTTPLSVMDRSVSKCGAAAWCAAAVPTCPISIRTQTPHAHAVRIRAEPDDRVCDIGLSTDSPRGQ